MGQNFDDYPGFHQTPGMPILLQQSVQTTKRCFKTDYPLKTAFYSLLTVFFIRSSS
jgi:hypothetical protein